MPPRTAQAASAIVLELAAVLAVLRNRGHGLGTPLLSGFTLAAAFIATGVC